MLSLVLAAFLTVTPQSLDKNAASPCVPTGKRVCTLAVRITTAKDSGAGTHNAVYFDIGPLSWRLQKDFKAGHTDEFDISPPTNLILTTDDILWLRLHKKGICGFSGTGDGLSGAWHPEKLDLIVNGALWKTAEIKEPLNSECWFWGEPVTMQPRQSYANATNFVRALRLQRQAELGPFSRFIAFATTIAKQSGISGWRKCPDETECQNGKRIKHCAEMPARVCASGHVLAVAKSTDGFATIDLDVTKIEFCDNVQPCESATVKDLDPVNRRFLRIEYRHKGRRVPCGGEDVRMCGRLLWDTDKEGWWEIHP